MRGLCKLQTVTLISHVLPRGDSEISLFQPWHVGDFHMSEGSCHIKASEQHALLPAYYIVSTRDSCRFRMAFTG